MVGSLRIEEVPIVLRQLERAHDSVEEDVVVLDDVAVGTHLALRLEVQLNDNGLSRNRVRGCPFGDHVVQLEGKEELPTIKALRGKTRTHFNKIESSISYSF